MKVSWKIRDSVAPEKRLRAVPHGSTVTLVACGCTVRRGLGPFLDFPDWPFEEQYIVQILQRGSACFNHWRGDGSWDYVADADAETDYDILTSALSEAFSDLQYTDNLC